MPKPSDIAKSVSRVSPLAHKASAPDPEKAARVAKARERLTPIAEVTPDLAEQLRNAMLRNQSIASGRRLPHLR